MRALRRLCLLCPVFACAATADAAPLIRAVGVVANDLACDNVNHRLYVTTPGSAGATGNTLRAIDPITATLGASVVVGPEPHRIAVSDDGQFAYVGLDGAAGVSKVALATFTLVQQFPLGSSVETGVRFVDDLEVMPGNPQTIAVSLRNNFASPRHEGVAIFDNGVMRATATPRHTGSNVIEFGATPDVLYGYDNEISEYGFRTMSVTATGVNITSTRAGLISGFDADFAFGGGKVVSTTGRVIDPVAGAILGGLNTAGPVAVEDDGSRAYILSGSAIQVFDLNTFARLDTITLPGNTGGYQIVRFGDDGLAVRSNNAIYLINSTSIPEPAMGLLALAWLTPFATRRRRR